MTQDSLHDAEMPSNQSLVVDYRQEHEVSQILPRSAVHRSIDWQGVEFQSHCQPAIIEMPEHISSQHIIAIHHTQHPVERYLDDRRQPESIASQDIVIVPSHVVHKCRCEDAAEKMVRFNLILLDPKHLEQIAYESIGADHIELIPTFAQSDPTIAQIGSLLRTELESARIDSPLYIDGLTTALAAHLLRQYCTVEQTIREYAGGLSQYKKQQAIDYIAAQLDEKLSLADIAAQLDLSVYYFCELFTQSMGMPPYKYVLQQRVDRAKQLLKHSEKSLREIAIDCGFANQPHLNRHFRKLTGVTPKMYRDR